MKKMNCLLYLFILINVFYSCEETEQGLPGNIIFWKFTDILDCGPINVNVIIDDVNIGTISQDFQPYDSIPACGSDNCLTLIKEKGSYVYTAECYCGLSNTKIGYWTGTFEVKNDSCSKVYLDIRKILKQ